MKRAMLLAAIAAASLAAPSNAAEPDLDTRVTQQDGWVGYHVPMVADGGDPCCFSWHDGATDRRGCDLDGRNWNFGSDDAHTSSPANPDHSLAVYLRVEHGRIDRVRAVSATCPVRSEHPVRWIDPVDPARSVRLLASLVDDAEAHGHDDFGLVAVAYHADASATRTLASRAEPSHPFKQREQALFWLGQARGQEGADIVEHYATTDGDPKLREQAIFALSQSHADDPYAHIRTIAHNDPAERVRSQALFWMAQMEDPRAKTDITATLGTEQSDKVREQAVFALSQLKDGDADDALIAVLRGDYPRSVKKQALFWLGQSGSPRAMAFFDETLK